MTRLTASNVLVQRSVAQAYWNSIIVQILKDLTVTTPSPR